jgi:hypothetical protein
MKKIIEYIYPTKYYYITAVILSIVLLAISDKIFLPTLNLLPLIFVIIFVLISAIIAILKNPNIGILITLAIMPFENIGGFYIYNSRTNK